MRKPDEAQRGARDRVEEAQEFNVAVHVGYDEVHVGATRSSKTALTRTYESQRSRQFAAYWASQ